MSISQAAWYAYERMPIPFDAVAARYDLLNDVISLGLHRRWKRSLVRELSAEAAPGSVILDVATGTGDLARLFERESLKTGASLRLLGLDPCGEMLERARARSAASIRWILAPAETLPLPDASVDVLSCAFGARNFSDRPKAFSEWRRVLRAGARGGILEIHPSARGPAGKMTGLYWKYCVPGIGAVFGRRSAYRYLSDSARAFVTTEELATELEAAGLRVLRAGSVFGSGMVGMIFFEKR